MSRTVASNAPIPWRVYPGGHLGRFPVGHRPGRASVSNDPVWALSSTPDGTLWASTESRTVQYVDGHWHRSEAPPMRFGFVSFAWYRDLLWAGGSLLAIYDQDRWRPVEGVNLEGISCLAVDKTNFLWVGTQASGLWRTTDGHYWEQVPLPSRGLSISTLCADEEGTLWVAESGRRPAIKPIYQWCNAQWEILPLPSKARTFTYIQALTLDTTKRLWAGSHRWGVWRWEKDVWAHFLAVNVDTKPGLPGNSVSALQVDRHQRIWAATNNGIGYYDGAVWRLVIVAPEPITVAGELLLWVPRLPRCLHLDGSGRLWIGTWDGEVGWIDTDQAPFANPLEYTTTYYEPTVVLFNERD